jgi:hypothetical protein
VTAEKQSFFPGDPATVWGHLAAELEVERIPGDHLNIVTTEFEGLASVLTRYIPTGFSSVHRMSNAKSGAMTFLRPAQF